VTELPAVLGAAWPSIFLGLFAIGLIPSVLVTLITLLYPKGHARRDEIRGEFDAIDSYVKRVIWVGELLELGLREGCPARYRYVVWKWRPRRKTESYREYGVRKAAKNYRFQGYDCYQSGDLIGAVYCFRRALRLLAGPANRGGLRVLLLRHLADALAEAGQHEASKQAGRQGAKEAKEMNRLSRRRLTRRTGWRG
jgi:hypothetical protein